MQHALLCEAISFSFKSDEIEGKFYPKRNEEKLRLSEGMQWRREEHETTVLLVHWERLGQNRREEEDLHGQRLRNHCHPVDCHDLYPSSSR